MSLLPLLFSTWWANLEQPHMLMDQNFGLGLRPEDLRLPKWTDRYYLPHIRDRAALVDLYYRPWADLLRPEGSGTYIYNEKYFNISIFKYFYSLVNFASFLEILLDFKYFLQQECFHFYFLVFNLESKK